MTKRSVTEKTDFTTVFGRVLAGFRKSLRFSQEKFAAELGYDRTLLSRIEAGRNVATVDNVHKIERALLRHEQIDGHGDMFLLAHRVARYLQKKGVRVVYGKAVPEEGERLLEDGLVDRVVTRHLEQWFKEDEEDEDEEETDDDEGQEEDADEDDDVWDDL